MGFKSALSKLMNANFWKRVGLILGGFILTDIAVENLMDFFPDLPFKHTVVSASVTAGIYSFAPKGTIRSNLSLGAGLGTASNFLEETGMNTMVENLGVKLRSPVA